MSDNERPPIHSDGWKQWSAQVKESLDKLEGKVDTLESRIRRHREEALVDITTLKVKAGVVGMVAGFVTSTIMSVLVGLLVYQLTVAQHQKVITPHKHPAPVEQTIDPIGYALPPKENGDIFKIVMREAKT